MGYELKLTGAPQGNHITALCTTAGYTAMCRWFESLSAEKYPAIAQFAANNAYSGSDQLVLQIDQALVESPPDDKAVFKVVDRFADLLGNGHPDETATAIS